MGQKLKNNLEKKIFIKTFGCQMNEYDSNRIYDITQNINYRKTDDLKKADCYVLNTCHIREKATEKVYHDIGRVKKEFKNKKKPIVIVTGCVAQAEGEILLEKEKYIDAVVGPQSYHLIKNILLKIERKKNKINLTDFNVVEKFDNLNYIMNSSTKISSYLTIQEGCDKFCKFCVVPYTRGPEYSRSIDELIKESNQLAKNGTREIILLGQNVNAYNYKNKKLSELILEISKIKEIKRIRYTTSHPLDFTEDLILAHQSIKKLMPLIHLPVQSGSNKILKNMNRKHTIEMYMDLIKKIKKANKFIEFSSDFIIGYPGETDKDFKASIEVMKNIKYINTYSFIFSPRPGTPAAKMSPTNEIIAKERLDLFQKISKDIKMNYRKSLFNKKSLVMFENKLKDNSGFFGRDEFLNPVIVKGNSNLIGKILNVKIIDGNHNTLFGQVDQKTKKEEFAA